ncbi:MAG: hypothetical protein EXR67_06715 [Dehalococcoidia bacterium]|nr:hypothetical protein [Dehalococcoidia bacterium]
MRFPDRLQASRKVFMFLCLGIVIVRAAACGEKPENPSLVGVLVSPIQATFDQTKFTTIYRAEFSGSDLSKTSLDGAWSGSNCGTPIVDRSEEGFIENMGQPISCTAGHIRTRRAQPATTRTRPLGSPLLRR